MDDRLFFSFKLSFSVLGFLVFTVTPAKPQAVFEMCADRIHQSRDCLLEIAEHAFSNGVQRANRDNLIEGVASRFIREQNFSAVERLVTLMVAEEFDPKHLMRIDGQIIELRFRTSINAARDYAEALPTENQRRDRAIWVFIRHLTEKHPNLALEEIRKRDFGEGGVRYFVPLIIASLSAKGRVDEALALIDEFPELTEITKANPLPPQVMLGGVLPMDMAVSMVVTQLVRTGRVQDAVSLARQNPEWNRAIRGMISNTHRNADPGNALEFAEAFGDQDLAQEIKLSLFRERIKNKDLSEARRLLRALVERYQQEVVRSMSRAYLLARDEEGLRSLVSELTDEKSLGEATLALAGLVAWQGQIEEAEGLISHLKAMGNNTETLDIYALAAEGYADRGDFDGLKEFFDKLTSGDKRQRVARIAIGRFIPKLEERDATLPHIREVIEFVARRGAGDEDSINDSARILLWRLTPDEVEIALAAGIYSPDETAHRALGARFNAAVGVGDWAGADELWAQRTPETQEFMTRLEPYLDRLPDADALALVEAVKDESSSGFRNRVLQALERRALSFASSGNPEASRAVRSVNRGHAISKNAQSLFKAGDLPAAVRALVDADPADQVRLSYRFWATR